MQIERKPSRWPYVGALIGLLIFCLTVPRYWHTNGDSFPATIEPGDFEPIGDPGWGGWPMGPVATAAPDAPTAIFDWNTLTLSNQGAPTIEDFLSAIETKAQAAWYGNEISWPRANPSMAWGVPTIEVGWIELAPKSTANQNRSPSSPPAPLAISALYQFGHAFARYSWQDIAEWIPRLAKLVRLWSAVEPFAQDGPALTPYGIADENANVQSWSSPDALHKQLATLAQHPYSARWAEETMSLVGALTRPGQSRPELAGALLRRLSQSAEEATRLADNARDDRLRAELLRAHWALARRLDRWAVVNDIRIASAARARIASRGSLDGLFAGPPLADDVPANIQSLNSDLEAYEHSRDPALARKITSSQRDLGSSSDSLERSLAGAVEQHYRNANVRIAVTADMLNRFVADERAQAGTVQERIAGTPVFGASNTLSQSRLLLAPDTGRWRMELEAEGIVESNTTADGGMAQLYSEGATDFVARKSIIVDHSGVRMEPASVTTYNRNRLVGVTTDFDWVPLFGSLARGQAENQYRAKRSRAKAEVEVRVATRAMKQLDEEAADRVARLEQDIRVRFAPFEDAGVTLTTVEMASTNERLVARFRLAGDYQLAGHTPRPRALSDSLASVQLHESALTNAAVGLGLDGKRFTAPELQAMLREKFPRMTLETPREAHDDTVFQFAYNDAVRFHIAEGKVELALAMDDFHHDGRRIRGFIVHAFYVPVVNGLDIELARDGALGIEGRLSSTDRARLHSVFKEVLPEDRRLPLVRLDDPENQRLTGLMVTQLVLEDGWLGMAIGPEAGGRVAERTRSLR